MPSSAVRLRDLQAILTLSHECRDLGDDPAGWRLHFAGGLARLADADLIVCGEFADVPARPTDLGAVVWGADHGFDMAGWANAQQHFRDDPTYGISLNRYLERWPAADGEAAGRSQLVTDAEWDRAVENRVVYRAAGADHPVWCFRSVPGSADAAGVVLVRAAGRRPFTARQVATVGVAIAAVGPLVGGPLARFTEPSPAALPPRVRQVLDCLLQGESDKEIAVRLGISRLTVHQYVKRVFTHFGAGTRAELLARWVRRGRGGRAG